MEKHSGILMTRVAAGSDSCHECVLNNAQSGHRTVKTDEKSNEITAIPELLNMLILKEKLSQLMRWVARKILQRDTKIGR